MNKLFNKLITVLIIIVDILWADNLTEWSWYFCAETRRRLPAVSVAIVAMNVSSSSSQRLCVIIIIIIIISIRCRTLAVKITKLDRYMYSIQAVARGVATGGGISVYIPPKSVYLNFFYVVVFSPWPIYTHPNQIPDYASGSCPSTAMS